MTGFLLEGERNRARRRREIRGNGNECLLGKQLKGAEVSKQAAVKNCIVKRLIFTARK